MMITSTQQQATESDDDFFISRESFYIAHLPFHLYSSGRYEKLYELLSADTVWLQDRFVKSGSDVAYRDDLRYALSSFRDPIPSQQIPILLRLYTVNAVIGARAMAYTTTQLAAMVWLGHADVARKAALLVGDVRERVLALIAIARALHQQSLLDHQLVEDVLTLAPLIVVDSDRTKLMREIAGLLSEIEDPRADDYFDRATVAALETSDAQRRPLAIHALIRSLIDANRLDSARVLLACFGPHDRHERARSLNQLTRALCLHGRVEEAEAIFRTQVLDSSSAPLNSSVEAKEYVDIFCALALASPASSTMLIDEVLQWIAQAKGTRWITPQLVTTLVRYGRYEEAESLITQIRSDDERATAIQGVAIALAPHDRRRAAQRFAEAWATFRESETPARSVMGLVTLMAAWRQALNSAPPALVAEIVERVLQISSAFGNTTLKPQIVNQLAEQGLFEAAEQVAHSISGASYRARALSEIALHMAKMKHEDASTRFNEAQQLALEAINEVYLATVAVHLGGMVSQLPEQPAQRQQIVRVTKEHIENLASSATRVKLLAEMTMQVCFSDEAQTDALLNEALAEADIATHEADRDAQRRWIAEALFKTRRVEAAQTLIDLLSFDTQVGLLSQLALQIWKGGEEDSARALLTRCRSLIGRIEEPLAYANALSIVASILAITGQPDSDSTFERAFAAVDAIEDDWEWVDANSTLIAALMRAGYHEQAQEMMNSSPLIQELDAIINEAAVEWLLDQTAYTQALAAAQVVNDDQERVFLLTRIATELALIGRLAEACVVLTSVPHGYTIVSPLDTFLEQVSGWLLKRIDLPLRLRLDALDNALEVATWFHPGWQPLHNLLMHSIAKPLDTSPL